MCLPGFVNDAHSTLAPAFNTYGMKNIYQSNEVISMSFGECIQLLGSQVLLIQRKSAFYLLFHVVVFCVGPARGQGLTQELQGENWNCNLRGSDEAQIIECLTSTLGHFDYILSRHG